MIRLIQSNRFCQPAEDEGLSRGVLSLCVQFLGPLNTRMLGGGVDVVKSRDGRASTQLFPAQYGGAFFDA